MRIPFQNELDDAFKSDRSIWIKIGGGALVGGLITLAMILREKSNTFGGVIGLIAVAITALIGGCVGLALSIKDVVQSRRDAGKSVHPLLRLFFGMGVLTLFMWIILAFGLAIGFAFLDSMTVTKKHRPAASRTVFDSVAANDRFEPNKRGVPSPLTPPCPALD